MVLMKKIILLFVLIFSIFYIGSCGKNNNNTNNNQNGNNNDDTILLEDMEPLAIDVDSLEIEGITISYIEDEVLKLYSDKIESIEITAVPINDDIISLIKGELIQHYGADIDVNKLIKDILITSAIIIIDVVCIVASAPSGGSSTAAGATISVALLKVSKTILDVSSKTAAIISAVGMAVDAAVEGVKAYNEGGDLTYILGHSLNGLVDGIKWSMIFLPFSLGVDKIISTIAQKKLLSKAMNYIDNIAKLLPNNVEAKAAEEIFINSMKNADQILDIVQKAIKNGEITSEVYESIVKIIGKSANNSSEIGKLIFDIFSKDKLDLYKLLKAFNPYDNIAKVTKKLQEGFLDISEEAFEEVRKGLVKKTITSLSDDLIVKNNLKNKILNNIDEFETLFGSVISNTLKKEIISEFLVSQGKNISKNSADDIVEKILSQLKHNGNLVNSLKNISNNNSNIKVMNLVNNLLDNPGIYNILSNYSSAKKFSTFIAQYNLLNNLNIYSDLSDNQLIELFENTISGKYKNINDIFKELGRVNGLGEITATSRKLLSIDYITVKEALDVLDNSENHKELLKSIAVMDLSKHYKIDDNVINSILSNNNYNDQIIEILAKFSMEKDSKILKYIEDFSSSLNLDSVVTKTFENANLSKETIESIKRGTSILDIFNENEYSTAIKLFNSLENVNMKLGTQYNVNFANDFNEVVLRYFENVVNSNHIVRHKITSQLLTDLGYDSTEVVLDIIYANYESAFDLQLVKEINDIYNLAITLGTNRSNLKVIEPEELSILVANLFDGNISSTDDIFRLMSENSANTITKNFTYGEALIDTINKLNNQNYDILIKNLQILSIADKLNNVVDNYKMFDVVADVINNNLTADEIINKYSYRVYYNFVEHGNLIVSKMISSNNNELMDLITRISIDTMYKAINDGSTEITVNMLDSILSGIPLLEIEGLTDKMIMNNYSYLFNYAKSISSNNLINELVDARTRFFKSLNIVEETLNNEYAGKSYTTILGDVVEFSTNGHVILDSYAIASITLELTGNSQNDIAKANLLFFGTSVGPQGYTWHHLEDGRTLILVPTYIHANVKHTGGAHYLRNFYDILLG